MALSAAVITAFTLTASAVSAGRVNTNSLRLRSGPSTSSSVVANYDAGKQVIIYDQDGDWYKVYVDGKEGYMAAEYVDKMDTVEFAAIPAKVATEILNLRQKPSTESSIIKQLTENTAISIIGVEDGWFKAKHADSVGYVHPSYIKLGAATSSGGEVVAARVETASGAGQSESGAATAQNVIEFAMSLRGVPYKYGGKSTSGFDCSGYTYYVFKQFGINLSGGASTQLGYGVKISRAELLPGDLVFFSHPSYPGYPAGHVGIYLGDNQFIHAPSPGKVVRVEDMGSGYYNDRYVGARRVLN